VSPCSSSIALGRGVHPRTAAGFTTSKVYRAFTRRRFLHLTERDDRPRITEPSKGQRGRFWSHPFYPGVTPRVGTAPSSQTSGPTRGGVGVGEISTTRADFCWDVLSEGAHGRESSNARGSAGTSSRHRPLRSQNPWSKEPGYFPSPEASSAHPPPPRLLTRLTTRIRKSELSSFPVRGPEKLFRGMNPGERA